MGTAESMVTEYHGGKTKVILFVPDRGNIRLIAVLMSGRLPGLEEVGYTPVVFPDLEEVGYMPVVFPGLEEVGYMPVLFPSRGGTQRTQKLRSHSAET